mmetsp:Transcript_17257/g.50128  ORF Transcript_17257/g.50128 Transcript_17257/m.50128 type:complete len:164 (+) Transcript_17257:269-760(+)
MACSMGRGKLICYCINRSNDAFVSPAVAGGSGRRGPVAIQIYIQWQFMTLQEGAPRIVLSFGKTTNNNQQGALRLLYLNPPLSTSIVLGGGFSMEEDEREVSHGLSYLGRTVNSTALFRPPVRGDALVVVSGRRLGSGRGHSLLLPCDDTPVRFILSPMPSQS